MKKTAKVLLAYLVSLFILAVPAGTPAEEEYYRIDVFVLMDSSNSMKQSDPDKLRFEAFRELAGQLEPGDRIGLINFGVSSKTVLPLTEIKDAAARERIVKMAIPDENLVYTDVKDALQKVCEDMQKAYDSEHLPFFILFTDGDIQPILNYETDRGFKKQYLEELGKVAEKYITKGWPVFSIDLDRNGQPGDPDLKKVSEATGAYMTNIRTPEKIKETFRSVLESIRKRKVEAEVKIREEESDAETLRLRTTSPDSGDYNILSRLDIRSELAVRGKRILPGENPDLQVIEMYAEVTEPGGAVKKLQLTDDGAVGSGDMKRGDGVYSAFYEPFEEGGFSIAVHAAGVYKGKQFNENSRITGLDAVARGKIMLRRADVSEIALIPGKARTVFIEAAADSQRLERVEFSMQGAENVGMEPVSAYLLNGRNNKVGLKLSADRNAVRGERGQLVVKAVSGNPDTVVSPETLTIPYIIKSDTTVVYTLTVLGALGIIFLAVFIIRTARRRSAEKRGWVKGLLVIRKGNDSKKQFVDLSSFKKDRIRLSAINTGGVDCILNVDEELDLTVYSETEGKKPAYYITGGIGCIVYTEEVPHKTLKLEHEVLFNIRSYVFYYDNPAMHDETKPGSNLLEKYEKEYS